jgi:hypothetical protein
MKEILRTQLGEFKKLKKNYFDNAPQIKTDLTDDNSRYKSGNSWWGNLNFRFSILESRGLLHEDLVKEYHNLMRDFKEGSREVISANNLLDRTINYLELEIH